MPSRTVFMKTAIPLSRIQRTQVLVAQNNWVTGIDEATGAAYYYNQQTGESQWEPPQQAAPQGYGAQVIWRLMPAAGVYSEFTVRNGEEVVLGSAHMVEQVPTVSEAQCLVQVAADGTATLVSLGYRPTALRARIGAPSFGLKQQATHVLRPGEQILLDGVTMSGIFTCQVETADMGVGGYPQQQQQQQGGSGNGW